MAGGDDFTTAMANLLADETRTLFTLLRSGGRGEEIDGKDAIPVDAVDRGLQELGFKSTAADEFIGRVRSQQSSSSSSSTSGGLLKYMDFREACLPLFIGTRPSGDAKGPFKGHGPLAGHSGLPSGLLVVCAHDPGAVSHTHPLFAMASSEGRRAIYVPLRNGKPWGGLSVAKAVLERIASMGRIAAVVTGCSTCKAELDITEACNKLRIPCCTVVDWNPSARLEPSAQNDPCLCLANLYIVTTQSAVNELAIRYNVDPKLVHICGSPSLEHTAKHAKARLSRDLVRSALGAEPAQRLASFFPGTMEGSPAGPDAVPAVFAALSNSFSTEGWLVVVGVHPRISEQTLQSIADCCHRHGFMLNHSVGGQGEPQCQVVVDNVSLLKASDVSLSVGGSMSLDSLAMGTPSAFFFSGLKDRGAHKETYVEALPVTRLYAPAHVEAFLDLALHWELRGRPANVLNCLGATTRAWETIKMSLMGRDPAQE